MTTITFSIDAIPPDGKPIGSLGASVEVMGQPAQCHLRQCLIFPNGLVANRPKVAIPAAQTKFDATGKLTGYATRDCISAYLAALKALLHQQPDRFDPGCAG
jgi:chromate reductase, NAD(P)H dehydrogenase (quinone)